MAQLIPPEPGLQTSSRAERDLFERFKTELDDRWTVLHSVGIANHRKKSWGELDFVAVGPTGIFCLEVKGGRIRREAGQWIFTRSDGRENRKSEGPFEQVGGAEAQLRRHLRELGHDRNADGRFAMGWGVMTPDITFEVQGPDVERQTVYDVNDRARPLGKYVERLTDYWSSRLEEQWHRRPVQLHPSDIEQVLRCLRPDFDLRPSLAARMGLSREDMVRLTEEQARLLDDWTLNERMIVMGGAGTGKTLLAVEEARAHAGEGRRVLLCCYTAALASWIGQALDDCPTVTVVHLHGLMNEMIDRAGTRHRLPDAEPNDLNSLFIPQLALDAVDELGLSESFDVALVDEAQDLLSDPYLDVIELLLAGGFEQGRWRLYYDPKQNLFSGIGKSAFPRLDAHRPARVRLHVNCRNTAPIATMTSLLAAVDLDETLHVDGPEVHHDFCRDANDLRRRVSRFLNRVRSDGTSLDDIVVLSRYRLENSGLRQGLVDVPFSLRSGPSDDPASQIRFRTTAQFKGLEADVVVLVDVDDLQDRAALGSLYVGASRARLLLAVFLDESTKDDYGLRAQEFGRRLLDDSADATATS